jgi:hypothetical protein
VLYKRLKTREHQLSALERDFQYIHAGSIFHYRLDILKKMLDTSDYISRNTYVTLGCDTNPTLDTD